MRKLFLFLAAIAMLCSCSTDELVEESNAELRSAQSSKGIVVISLGLKYALSNNQSPAAYMEVCKEGWVSGKEKFDLEIGSILCDGQDPRSSDFHVTSYWNIVNNNLPSWAGDIPIPFHGLDMWSSLNILVSTNSAFNLDEEYAAVYAEDFEMAGFDFVFEDANGNKLGTVYVDNDNVGDGDWLNVNESWNNYAIFSTQYNDYYFCVENYELTNHNRDYGFTWLD